MPISATGISKSRGLSPANHRRQQGFSLLELMVVLLIVGILMTLGVLSMNLGSQQGKVQEEVQRIRGVLELAQEEAVLKHQELALRLKPHSYAFAQLTTDKDGKVKWVDIEKDRQYQIHRLPDGMVLHVQVKDGSLAMSGTKGATEAMVYVLSSGEVSPFELSIKAQDGSEYALSGDFLGRTNSYDPRQDSGS